MKAYQSPAPGGRKYGLLGLRKEGAEEMNDMTVDAHASPSRTMGVDEFLAFLETRPKGEHWDLIEGVVVMMSPAGYVHQRVASNFSDLLNDATGCLFCCRAACGRSRA
jgi:hypothetical protein